MTEADWLAATDPAPMLEFLQGKGNSRKLRLFACACCRRIWNALGYYEVNKKGVEVAERYADGLATVEELLAAHDVIDASGDTRDTAADYVTAANLSVVCQAAEAAAWLAAFVALLNKNKDGNRPPSWEYRVEEAERREQLLLLRDIFGDPFSLAYLDPAWLASNDGVVGRLAEAAYQERELPGGHLSLARLALVADALEDAGCADGDILGHLRGSGPHVRGCWAVDLLLAK